MRKQIVTVSVLLCSRAVLAMSPENRAFGSLQRSVPT